MGSSGGDDGVAIGTAPSLGEGGSTLPCRDPQHNWLARWTLYRTLLTSVVSEGFIQTMYKVGSMVVMAAVPDNLPFVACAGCGQIMKLIDSVPKPRRSSRVACFRLSFVRRSRVKAGSPPSIARPQFTPLSLAAAGFAPGADSQASEESFRAVQRIIPARGELLHASRIGLSRVAHPSPQRPPPFGD